jgi:hypothetical protein
MSINMLVEIYLVVSKEGMRLWWPNNKQASSNGFSMLFMTQNSIFRGRK